ncbi:putative prophage DNA primase [Escherichia coli]|nr:putative prophage DNA primase [Escherichia coli]
MIFYTFPATFEKEIACGFNAKQFAEVLKKAGMLTHQTAVVDTKENHHVFRDDK